MVSGHCPTKGRGIDVVRNKIKAFAQKKVTLPPGRHKIVILDEADRCVPMTFPCPAPCSWPCSMTAGAQQALRRTMEIYANTTRFALACNMSNKIIEPIQSRCAILRYAKLRDQEVLKRLLEICESEKVMSTHHDACTCSSPPGRRYNTATRVLRLSSSLRREICVRLSIICSQHGLGSASFLGTMSSKCAISHIPLLCKL